MVLHNNKWDRKQNRNRIRKLKANGKDDPASKDKDKAKGKDKDRDRDKDELYTVRGENMDSDTDSNTEEGKEQEEGSQVSKEVATGEGEGNEEVSHGPFSRRKVASNAWRYEEDDPGFPLDSSQPLPEEPEENYVGLTLARTGGQLKDAEEEKVRTGLIDKEFLNESWGHEGQLKGKGKVIKVDRKDFVEVTERITKRNNVDAFRARFENRTKARTPAVGDGVRGGGGGGGGDGGDDLDAFLGKLDLDLETDREAALLNAAKASREIRPALGEGVDGDDEWLDQMLGGR